MKFTKLIIDVSNLYHKGYHSSKKYEKNINKDEKIHLGGIIISLKMINYYRNKYLAKENGEIVFCFDNPSSKLDSRKLLDSQYKGGRIKQSPEFYKGLDYLKLILMNRSDGDRLISVVFAEADDIVKPLLDEIDINNSRILMISEDLDWARSIDKNVYWYAKKTIWDKELFKNKYGFDPSKNGVIIYKTIRGDSIDKINPGIPNIREPIVLRIVKDFDNIYTFLSTYHKLDYINEHWRKVIKENEERLRKNYNLVNFIELSSEVLSEYTIISKLNESRLRSIYKALKIPNITDLEPCLMSKFPVPSDTEPNVIIDDVSSFLQPQSYKRSK